ncbi:MAG TPA: DoxX family protein [Ktedonobacteraceae bacterium]
MNIILWVIQAFLAIAFLMAGFLKSTQPVNKLAPTMPWVRDVRVVWPRFIGICEVLGAIGLVLPGITHIQTWLTVVSAGGLAMIMIDAALFHRRRHEYSMITVNAVLFVLAVLVVYGRWVLVPLT